MYAMGLALSSDRTSLLSASHLKARSSALGISPEGSRAAVGAIVGDPNGTLFVGETLGYPICNDGNPEAETNTGFVVVLEVWVMGRTEGSVQGKVVAGPTVTGLGCPSCALGEFEGAKVGSRVFDGISDTLDAELKGDGCQVVPGSEPIGLYDGNRLGCPVCGSNGDEETVRPLGSSEEYCSED
ncbi:hypothetical protein ACA910_005386 [Epithemia clementina (nom. ined.)]